MKSRAVPQRTWGVLGRVVSRRRGEVWPGPGTAARDLPHAPTKRWTTPAAIRAPPVRGASIRLEDADAEPVRFGALRWCGWAIGEFTQITRISVVVSWRSRRRRLRLASSRPSAGAAVTADAFHVALRDAAEQLFRREAEWREHWPGSASLRQSLRRTARARRPSRTSGVSIAEVALWLARQPVPVSFERDGCRCDPPIGSVRSAAHLVRQAKARAAPSCRQAPRCGKPTPRGPCRAAA